MHRAAQDLDSLELVPLHATLVLRHDKVGHAQLRQDVSPEGHDPRTEEQLPGDLVGEGEHVRELHVPAEEVVLGEERFVASIEDPHLQSTRNIKYLSWSAILSIMSV